MDIEQVTKNNYLILRVLNTVDIQSDLTELKDLIHKKMDEGQLFMAVSLTAQSHLSSVSIGLVLRCFMDLKERKGNLAIIQPNKNDSELLQLLSFACVIDIYESEDALFAGEERKES